MMKMPNDCTIGIIFNILYLYGFFFVRNTYQIIFSTYRVSYSYLFMNFRSRCLFSQGQYKSVFKHNIYIN